MMPTEYYVKGMVRCVNKPWDFLNEVDLTPLDGRLNRLFSTALCREYAAKNKTLRRVVDFSEDKADGNPGIGGERGPRLTVPHPNTASGFARYNLYFAVSLLRGGRYPLPPGAVSYQLATHVWRRDGIKARRDEYARHGLILAHLMGADWEFDPRWRTSVTVPMAETVYATKDWSSLPVLADALQDSGCEDPNVLTYLRGPGPFFRGTKILDDLLGKR